MAGSIDGKGVGHGRSNRHRDVELIRSNSDDELRELGARARELADDAREVHVMFNNNRGDDAPQAAARLRQLLR